MSWKRVYAYFDYEIINRIGIPDSLPLLNNTTAQMEEEIQIVVNREASVIQDQNVSCFTSFMKSQEDSISTG